jgi:hypothetical protein
MGDPLQVLLEILAWQEISDETILIFGPLGLKYHAIEDIW